MSVVESSTQTRSEDGFSVSAASHFCIGRQPIYDAARQIRGYELLYRRLPSESAAIVSNPDQASAYVLLKSFLELGLTRASAAQPVFVNCTKALLGLDPIIPPETCVLEVLEDVPADPETSQSLERLKALGYRIALDDFVAGDPRWPLVRLASHVKIDVRLVPPDKRQQLVGRLRRHPVTVLAEKIESEQEFHHFRDLGCELFQGYFLRRPETLTGKRIPSNRLSVLQLISRCADPDSSIPAIAAAISRDASLSYGLLRLANSALFGGSNVRSLEGAVMALGIDRVYRWSVLIVLADLNDGPPGYLEFAVQRARACELIAEARDTPCFEAYLVGMLSTLDSVLDIPLDAVVSSLPLDAVLKDAILHRSGSLGAILETVLAYEAGNFEGATLLGVPLRDIQRAFWESAEYSASMLAGLSTSPDKGC